MKLIDKVQMIRGFGGSLLDEVKAEA